MEKALTPLQIVVLAAGHGKRMNNSELPKVLLPLRGKPIIKYLLEAIKKSEVTARPVIVIGQKAEMVKEALGPDYDYVFQAEQLGTGHAVACTKELLKDGAANIMVLYGDHPLIMPETIKRLTGFHLNSNAVITMATAKLQDFSEWRSVFEVFGRISRDAQGHIVKITEKKDASGDELKITEVNPAYYCFKASWLWQNLSHLQNNNTQHEYYLTDLVGIACHEREKITTIEIDPREALGINTLEQLEIVVDFID